ncbi:F-box/RNI-like/FBD-like domains-containing protein [Euphorbia peplus]|nr:F-box/RNI-like/FBD-like domains-containing protein [Euphorbia peplus]
MSQKVKLPRNLFNCASIVVLKVGSGIDLDVPESVSFPSLKSVHFQSLESLSDATINRILSGSPILEELVIHRDKQDDVETFLIVSCSLKTLIIRNSEGNDSHNYQVVIDAPKLESVQLFDSRSSVKVDSIEIKNAPSLVKSTFEFPVWYCSDVVELTKTTCSLYEIRNVKVLSCPLSMLKALLSNPNVRFNNLTRLMVNYCGKDLSRLLQILAKLLNLKVLILHKRYTCTHKITWEAWEHEKSEISRLKCSLTLKRLQIEEFNGCKEDMELLKYFLENARVLNEIRIVRRYSTNEESAVLNMLLAYPRCSNAFKIIIV